MQYLIENSATKTARNIVKVALEHKSMFFPVIIQVAVLIYCFDMLTYEVNITLVL